MSYIYHTKNAGWTAQADRTVQPFPSGLCRISQSYIAKNSDVNYSTFAQGSVFPDSSPCIDGAYVFPEPTYENMGNGFTRVRVTAYGRVNTTGVTSEQIVDSFLNLNLPAEFTIDGSQVNGLAYVYTFAKMPRFTRKFVDVDGALADDLTLNINNNFKKSIYVGTVWGGYMSYLDFENQILGIDLGFDFVIRQTTVPIVLNTLKGDYPYFFRPFSSGASVQLTANPIFGELQSINFGFFNEYTISYLARATMTLRNPQI